MSADDLKQDIDLINGFANDYSTRSTLINQKITNTIQNLDKIINEEKQNDLFLSNLQNKVTEAELNNTLKSLLQLRDTLANKFSEYNTIIQSNTKKINQISSVIKENKTLISNVFDVMKKLDENISIVDEKLVK